MRNAFDEFESKLENRQKTLALTRKRQRQETRRERRDAVRRLEAYVRILAIMPPSTYDRGEVVSAAHLR